MENGTVRLTSDGYLKVKISNGHWELKARLDYERENGNLADDEVLYRLDGNKSNDNPENLRIIKRRTMAKIRNQALKNETEYMNAAITLTELIDKVADV